MACPAAGGGALGGGGAGWAAADCAESTADGATRSKGNMSLAALAAIFVGFITNSLCVLAAPESI